MSSPAAQNPAAPFLPLFLSRDYERLIETAKPLLSKPEKIETESIILLSHALERLGRSTDALELLQKSYDRLPHRDARDQDAKRQDVTRHDADRAASLLLRRAGILNHASRSALALKEVAKSAEHDPEKKHDLKRRVEEGIALSNLGKHDDAHALLLKAYDDAADIRYHGGSLRHPGHSIHAGLTTRSAAALALLEFRRAHLPEAEEWCGRALAVEDAGLEEERALAFRYRAIIRSAECRYRESLEDYAAALTLYRGLRHMRGLLRTYLSMAVTYEEMGEPDPAEIFLEKALGMAEEDQDPSSLAVALSRLGVIHLSQGRLEKALEYFERDLTIARRIENPRNAAFPLRHLGRTLALLGREKEALDRLNESAGIFSAAGDRINEALAQLEMLPLKSDHAKNENRAAGTFPVEERLIRLATIRELLASVGRHTLMPLVSQTEAMLLVAARRFDDAENAISRADQLFAGWHRVNRRAELHWKFARALADAGRKDLAVSSLTRGIEIARKAQLGALAKVMTAMLDSLDENAFIATTIESSVERRLRSPEATVTPQATELIGDSPAMLRVKEMIRAVGSTEAPTIVFGETGTGKELVAHSIHACSGRSRGPFIPINCGAIPSELVEAELFGHVKGAFTGAHVHRLGAFELADGGTIFLDEVAELPLPGQVKLLRVLQSGEYQKVGDPKPRTVDVRVIAATHRNITEEMRCGRFRADLFYRLAAFEIVLPPLYERLPDLAALVTHLLSRHAIAHKKGITGISPAALKTLAEYRWPGNIRELENVLTRAVILAKGEKIGVRDLPVLSASGAGEERFPTLREMTDRHIEEAMKRAAGNRSRAAQLLGVHRNTLLGRRGGK